MPFRRLATLTLVAVVTLSAALATSATSAGAATSSATRSTTKTAPPAPGAFVPVGLTGYPGLLDTRGGPRPAIAPQGTRKLTVTGAHDVPADAAAVVLNVTVANATSTGYVTAWPDGQPRPTASNLNHVAEESIANVVTVAVGAAGQVDFYNGSTGRIDLLVGIEGYYQAGSPTAPGMFVALTPTRLLDTRHGVGAPAHAVGSDATVNLTIGGAAAGGVPSNAKAVVMNLTATAPTKTGFLTAYPTGGTRPTASNLNYSRGRTVPNLVTVALGSAGRVSIYNGSSGTVQLVADVAGYYIGGTATDDGAFVPLTPARILDTRNATGAPVGPVRRDGEVGLQVVGVGGVPMTGVRAVAMNVTVTQPTRGQGVALVPSAVNRPYAATLSFVAGQTIADAAIVSPGLCSKLELINTGGQGSVQLIADVAGYFIDTNSPAQTDPAKPAVKAIGANAFGDLGNGTTTATRTPSTMLNVIDARSVSGGELAVTNDGEVFGWGQQQPLWIGVNASHDQGYRNCGFPSPIGLNETVVDAAGSPTSGYALTDLGQVFAWGVDDEGQLGREILGGTYNQPDLVPGLIDGGHTVLAIGRGMAIRDDHTLWTWGPNDKGQLGRGSTAQFVAAPAQVTALGSNVKAIAQLGQTSYVLRSDGTVWAMGDNASGALGTGASSTTTPSSNVPVQVKGVGGTGLLTGVLSIGPGAAVVADHTVVTWGTNAHGRLGIGTTTGFSGVPVAVTEPVGMPDVTALDSGPSHLVALGSDGSVWAWGVALANGRSADSGTPAQVAGLSGVTAVAAGVNTTYAVSQPAP